jgi:hypothetical protein
MDETISDPLLQNSVEWSYEVTKSTISLNSCCKFEAHRLNEARLSLYE